LADGYRNRPELTAEKFVPNPFSPGDRLYLTGDIARIVNNEIYLQGRKDDQVKIRGYLVELYEVEKNLMQISPVERAVAAVIPDASGTPVLCAWVTGCSPDQVQEVKSKLFLPDYMVPVHIMAVDTLPSGASGKVDKSKLPDPFTSLTDNTVYEAPESESEKALAAVFTTVLGKENPGLNDNFFDLGGDSIKAVQVSADMYKHGYRLDVKDLFNNGNLRHLASISDKNSHTEESNHTGREITRDQEDVETIKAMYSR
jgi:bacitracin synthase 3